MSWGLFKKIIDESAGRVRRLALYGFGEPLNHPRFVEFAAYARAVLGDRAFIHFVTNGTLMDGYTARRVFEAGVDQVAFSVDAPDLKPLSEIRVGAQRYDVLGNLRETARVKRDYGARVGVAVVLMKRNYRMLPEIVERAGELGLDFVVVSQMVPYHPALVGESVYTMASREAVSFFKETGGKLDALAREAIYDSMLAHYTYASSGRRQLYIQLVEKIASKGYSVNADIAGEAIRREALLREVEEYIEKAREVARTYGLEARLPSVYADALKRSCPYVDENAMMILWDGSVAPCMDLAYDHPLYTNFHVKRIRAVRFGNVAQESIEEVWNKPRYVQFRRVRRKMPSSVPWCADCPFATKKCWFIDANEYDCYGNEVGCNECIYSAGLAHCIL